MHIFRKRKGGKAGISNIDQVCEMKTSRECKCSRKKRKYSLNLLYSRNSKEAKQGLTEKGTEGPAISEQAQRGN